MNNDHASGGPAGMLWAALMAAACAAVEMALNGSWGDATGLVIAGAALVGVFLHVRRDDPYRRDDDEDLDRPDPRGPDGIDLALWDLIDAQCTPSAHPRVPLAAGCG